MYCIMFHRYTGHHTKTEADGKWVTYKGYAHEFSSLKRQDFRLAPNAFDVLRKCLFVTFDNTPWALKRLQTSRLNDQAIPGVFPGLFEISHGVRQVFNVKQCESSIVEAWLWLKSQYDAGMAKAIGDGKIFLAEVFLRGYFCSMSWQNYYAKHSRTI